MTAWHTKHLCMDQISFDVLIKSCDQIIKCDRIWEKGPLIFTLNATFDNVQILKNISA